MTTTITEAELLDALLAATSGTEPEDARTAREMAAAHGIAASRVNKALRALHAQGRLQAHWVTRTGIDGRAAKVPAYTILPAR